MVAARKTRESKPVAIVLWRFCKLLTHWLPCVGLVESGNHLWALQGRRHGVLLLHHEAFF